MSKPITQEDLETKILKFFDTEGKTDPVFEENFHETLLEAIKSADVDARDTAYKYLKFIQDETYFDSFHQTIVTILTHKHQDEGDTNYHKHNIGERLSLTAHALEARKFYNGDQKEIIAFWDNIIDIAKDYKQSSCRFVQGLATKKIPLSRLPHFSN